MSNIGRASAILQDARINGVRVGGLSELNLKAALFCRRQGQICRLIGCRQVKTFTYIFRMALTEIRVYDLMVAVAAGMTTWLHLDL